MYSTIPAVALGGLYLGLHALASTLPTLLLPQLVTIFLCLMYTVAPPAMMSFFMVSVTAQHLWSTWSRDSLVSFCSILAEAELESSLCAEFPDGIFHLPFGHLEAILVIRYTIRVPQNLF